MWRGLKTANLAVEAVCLLETCFLLLAAATQTNRARESRSFFRMLLALFVVLLSDLVS